MKPSDTRVRWSWRKLQDVTVQVWPELEEARIVSYLVHADYWLGVAELGEAGKGGAKWKGRIPK